VYADLQLKPASNTATILGAVAVGLAALAIGSLLLGYCFLNTRRQEIAPVPQYQQHQNIYNKQPFGV